MKSGLTIVEMAQQIERQSKLKQDYLLDTRRLQVEPFGSQLYLHTFDDHDDPLVEPLEINQIAHRQIGTHLKIPAAYYDRMLSDYPELLAENVNSWFQREPTQRMVRTLDGTVRAFLSKDGEHCGTAVASVIGQIRRKLTPDTPKGGYIRTVLGSGYKFNSSPF